MEPTTTLIVVGALAVAAAVWGIAQVVLAVTRPEQRRVRERLGGDGPREGDRERSPILKRQPSVPGQPGLAGSSTFLRQLENRLQLVSPATTTGRHLALSLIAGIVAGAALTYLAGSPLVGAGAGGVAAVVPTFLVNQRYARRQKVISDQLIEALDFLARVLRAGHSFATGLQMVGQELPEPIAFEFRKCYQQHDLGQPLEGALSEMAARINLTPFNFFVSSVLIQRQTGGDLAEILDNISRTIRARIRLQQHLKALTSEGRTTGYVLTALPIVIFFIMYASNPDYAGTLLVTDIGRMLLVGCVVLLILGQWMIKKIMNIQV